MICRCLSSLNSQIILQRPPFVKHQWLPSLLHYSGSATKKGKAAPLQERKMRDRVRLWAKGGEGGIGCHSFRRTRTDRYGKPDGGNGGRGGDVILECSSAVWDFSNLQHHLNAIRGGNGESKNRIGSRGSDKVVQVPVGTVIHLVRGETPSFVVETSDKYLQPWEIPDDDNSDDSTDSLRSLKLEATDDSISPKPTDFLPKLSGPYHKASETRDSGEAKGKTSVKYSHSRYRSNDSGIKAVEYDSDTYKTESDEENRNKDREGESSKDNKSRKIITSSCPRYRTNNRGIKAIEYNLATYKTESEEENEDGDEERFEEAESEEEVEYSVAELTKPGQRLIVARGGEGGVGTVALKKRSKANKSHKTIKHHNDSSDTELDESENNSLSSGVPGTESVLILELKSLADVGLVGMPNAGKSTLLGSISRAKPTVGHYAFTTLRPNIGNLNYDDFFSMTVADIPGLIKGAHENRGLGYAFLRHIERTRVLAYVVDLASGIKPWEQLRDLVLELEYHQEGLSKKPSLVVANKIDEKGAEIVYEELKRRVEGVSIFPVCAVLEEGVDEVKVGLRKLMDGRETQCLDLDRIIID